MDKKTRIEHLLKELAAAASNSTGYFHASLSDDFTEKEQEHYLHLSNEYEEDVKKLTQKILNLID